MRVGFAMRGSPPHAGKGHQWRVAGGDVMGLTPARGEGTDNGRDSGDGLRAHPRTRGRDRCRCGPVVLPLGSPPHAGKGPVAAAMLFGREGLTPARGEGTPSGRRCGMTCRAHPRTRGRDAKVQRQRSGSGGSPPHAGKGLSGVGGRHEAPGLTPARGEGTTEPTLAGCTTWAHPRTRGRDCEPWPLTNSRSRLTPARGEGTTGSSAR